MTELEIRGKRQDKSDGFASGVLILSLSTVIVKIIGLIYKIPMLTLLGSEGMGYFNSAYEIYTLFGVVSTAGLPVAMSVLIARARCGGELTEKKIFSAAMTLFLSLGVVGSLLMLGLAPIFSSALGSDRAVFCMIAISPTVFFICLSSVYRGFFQGLGRMRETAISQVIEAALKLILGLVFAYIALRCGYSAPKVAACAVMGLVAGSAASALYLALSKRAHGRSLNGADRCGADGRCPKNECSDTLGIEKKSEQGRRRICRELLTIAIPITLSSAVISITKIIDMTVILRRMQDIGYQSAEAFSVYGSYTTLALPLFSLAPALISSVALPLVPALASAVARGDKDEQVAVVGDAVRLTMIISMPISLGLSLFSREILSLIFAWQESAVALSAPLLSILALSVPLACLITVESAILQAYSRAGLPIISMLAGSAIKLLTAYFLIGDPDICIVGAPISTFFCDLVINAINWVFIGRLLPRGLDFGTIAKPFFAAFMSVGVSRLALAALAARFGSSGVMTLGAVALSALIYLPLSFFVGAVRREDIARMPIINKRFSRKLENKII
ncbi:MAG: polysaccharide biosynthesis protein [Clostridia bacterium]|nr:polysaccharide biosynthesis protein [Clostridia bacterium]